MSNEISNENTTHQSDKSPTPNASANDKVTPQPRLTKRARALEIEKRRRRFLLIRILGFIPVNYLQARTAIRNGLKFQAALDLADAYGVSLAVMAKALTIPAGSINRRRQAGLLLPAESDRAYRLARLFDDVFHLLEGDDQATRDWLCTPNHHFSYESPLQHCDTLPSALHVELTVFYWRDGELDNPFSR